MQYNESLKKSQEIIETLIQHFDGTDDRSMVHAFSNGREQGFFITNLHHAVAIAKNRNSDEWVVYYDLSMEFDVTTHHPRDWERRKIFRQGNEEGLVDFIINWMEVKDDVS